LSAFKFFTNLTSFVSDSIVSFYSALRLSKLKMYWVCSKKISSKFRAGPAKRITPRTSLLFEATFEAQTAPKLWPNK
jgi:hypothetical protein